MCAIISPSRSLMGAHRHTKTPINSPTLRRIILNGKRAGNCLSSHLLHRTTIALRSSNVAYKSCMYARNMISLLYRLVMGLFFNVLRLFTDEGSSQKPMSLSTNAIKSQARHTDDRQKMMMVCGLEVYTIVVKIQLSRNRAI